MERHYKVRWRRYFFDGRKPTNDALIEPVSIGVATKLIERYRKYDAKGGPFCDYWLYPI